MEDHELKPSQEDCAAMIRSATFNILVAAILKEMGSKDSAAIWALSDHLQAHGFNQAGNTLRGMVDGANADWFVHSTDMKVSRPKGHVRRKIDLVLHVVGTELMPEVDED